MTLGLKVTSSAGDGFTVTASDGDRLILTPDNFGSPIPVTLTELAEDYQSVDGNALPNALPPTEADVLAEHNARANFGLNQRYARGVLGKGHATDADQRGFQRTAADRPPPAGSPEAFFRKLAAADEAEAKPKGRRSKATT
jgi:hypothetical protein